MAFFSALLGASALLVVSAPGPAMAAESGSDWPFDRNNVSADQDSASSSDATQTNEQTGQAPGEPLVFPPVSPPATRGGPIRILPPMLEDDGGVAGNGGIANPDASPPNGDMTLFPAGPGVGGRATTPVQSLGARPGEAGSGIEMGALGQLDEASVGLLDINNGGLGAAMWDGTGRQVVERLLGQVPGPSTSPFMSDLSKRLLLSAARPPQGANSGVSLLALRLQRLNAAGRSHEIVQLMARTGGARPSPAAAMEFAKAALGAGDAGRACSMLAAIPVGGDLSSDPVASFALKLSIFCQISGGRLGAANLTADLAREQGLDDPYFLALAAAATDGLRLDAQAPPTIDALTFQMMQLADRSLPDNAVALLEPGLLVSVASEGAFDPELRVAASERAAALGLISGDEMAAAYLGVPYTREDVSGVRIGREPASPYRRRALFHRAVVDERVPAGRADILSSLFFREADGPAYRATLIAHQGSLSTVPPSGVLTAFAPLAARAFIEQGDRVRAGMWLAVLEGQNVSLRQQRELRALLRLIDPGTLISPLSPPLSPLGGGVAAEGGDVIAPFLQDALDDLPNGGKARDFAAVEIVLLDALGLQMPSSVWGALLAAGDLPSGVVPPPALMRQLKLMSDGGHVGGTVLLTLAALAEAGPAGTHPKSLGEMVAALRQVGLEGDARRLAVEVLLARMSEEG